MSGETEKCSPCQQEISSGNRKKFKSQERHSYPWLRDKGAKLVMLCEREGWNTLFPLSLTTTSANHACLCIHVCRRGQLMLSCVCYIALPYDAA